MSTQHIGRHRTTNPLDIGDRMPGPIVASNIEASIFGGLLFLGVTSMEGNTATFVVNGEGQDALRAVLTPRREAVPSDPFVRTEDMVPPPFDAVAWAIQNGLES